MKSKAQNINDKIDSLYDELKTIQDKCKHKNVKKTHRSDLGNYDPSIDRYYTEFFCPTCLKNWTREGSL